MDDRINKTRMSWKAFSLFCLSLILLVGVYFVPAWHISLEAPQLPEGLGLYIWIHQLTGEGGPKDLHTLNILNHYVGMKEIEPEKILEFKIIKYLLGVLIGLGVLVALSRRIRLLQVWVALLVLMGAVGMVDFYAWGYDYGHTLDFAPFNSPKFLFKIDLKHSQDLDRGEISGSLREAFAKEESTIPGGTTLDIRRKGDSWLLCQKKWIFLRYGSFLMKKVGDKIKVYKPIDAYQPPVLGSKKFKNIISHSYPAWGGVFCFLAFLFSFIALFFPKKNPLAPPSEKAEKSRPEEKTDSNGKAGSVILLLASLSLSALFLSSCTPQKEPLEFGKDSCGYCKMAIADQRYGAEIVTQKGRIHKFDSLECMIAFSLEGKIKKEEIHSRWVIDFGNPGKLIEYSSSLFLYNPKLPSPMGLHVSSFSKKENLDRIERECGGEKISLAQVEEKAKKWLLAWNKKGSEEEKPYPFTSSAKTRAERR